MWQIIVLGVLIGVPLGYAMQRTHLCFNSAYREALLRRNTVLLRAIVLAVLIQMTGLALLVRLGIGGVTLNVVPFYWITAILGGFVFGLAMVYAEGCSSTVWYRVGNGNLGSLVTLVGFALGEAAMSSGPLAGVREWLQGAEVVLPGDAPATLPNALGVDAWWVVIPITLAAGWWLARGRGGSYHGGWDWRLAGSVLGVIGAAAWLAAWPTGWRYGVGIVGGTGAIVRAIFEGPRALNWGSYVVLTLPVGALIAAWQKGEFRWQVPDWPSTLRMATAGAVMGVSATLAGGCNVGHGFTGVPTLALSSLVATTFTFLGAWLGNRMRFASSSQS